MLAEKAARRLGEVGGFLGIVGLESTCGRHLDPKPGTTPVLSGSIANARPE
ncbi:hypothetical protein [Mycolicibacterium sp. P9-64]|uniref:hypothetical protein n=1 Tax=Mycolicibacterium sp. P9-64 TaxID=2024612 RepID=UPI001565655D|nr:hypothetical protein [Mycolicibacterium sp. P9-64]